MTPEHTRLVVSIADRKPGCRAPVRRTTSRPLRGKNRLPVTRRRADQCERSIRDSPRDLIEQSSRLDNAQPRTWLADPARRRVIRGGGSVRRVRGVGWVGSHGGCSAALSNTDSTILISAGVGTCCRLCVPRPDQAAVREARDSTIVPVATVGHPPSGLKVTLSPYSVVGGGWRAGRLPDLSRFQCWCLWPRAGPARCAACPRRGRPRRAVPGLLSLPR